MKPITYLPLLDEWNDKEKVKEDLPKIYSYYNFNLLDKLLDVYMEGLFSDKNIDFPLYELTKEEFKKTEDINLGEMNPHLIKEHEKYINFETDKYKYYKMCHYTITKWNYYYIRVEM